MTFDADLRVLRPAAGGNGRLLFVVANRGLLGGVPFSADAAFQFGPDELLDPGDGFLLDRGWTIAWCGWQWDVIRGVGSLGLTAPVADVEPGWLRVEFRPDTLVPATRCWTHQCSSGFGNTPRLMWRMPPRR